MIGQAVYMNKNEVSFHALFEAGKQFNWLSKNKKMTFRLTITEFYQQYRVVPAAHVLRIRVGIQLYVAFKVCKILKVLL